jgi:EAL domain-containing protein (putative c-di-GMP-specific phosphodiesterase class I)
MAAADVDPRILSFEITESSFIQDVDASVEAIDELKALGVNILIDDFGTAYSSLNYLSRFNVDYLKIDMSFIRGITTRKSDEAIVRAIIAMAHSLNMKTIAEGSKRRNSFIFLDIWNATSSKAFFLANQYLLKIWLRSI